LDVAGAGLGGIYKAGPYIEAMGSMIDKTKKNIKRKIQQICAGRRHLSW